MKLLVLTDTHLGLRGDEPAFFPFMKRSNDYMFSIVDSLGIKDAIHLGDLFDRRKYVNFITAKHCREDLIEPFVQRGINLHILAGNHDVFHKNTNEVNSLEELIGNRYPNITIHTEPCEVTYGGKNILLIPWIPDSKEIREKIFKTLQESNSHIAFGHLEINGFKMDGGAVCSHGLDTNIFSKFEVVASGHFHKPQKVGNIRYIGAMYHNNWGEYGEDRGFSIFDTDTEEFTFYKNPNAIYTQLVYNDEKRETKIMDFLKAGNFSDYQDKYVRILVETKKNPQLLDILMDNITESGPIKLTVDDLTTALDNPDVDVILDQAQDTLSILGKYVDDLGLELDPSRVKLFLTNTYKEAVTLDSIE